MTLNRDYDFEGNRDWLGGSQGGSVSYVWNNQKLQSIAMTTEESKMAAVDFNYDTMGRLASLKRTANGDPSTTISTSYTLDLLDRVTGITHQKVAGEVATTLSAFTYGYDANGRVASYTGPEGSLSFAVDANGQLLSVTGARSEAFAFDPNGNRSSSTTGTGNLLLSDSQFSYTYDLEGNRKTRTRLSDGQLTEYFWDHRNQLTKALIKDASGNLLKELRFTYDVEGRRVGSWVDGDGAGPADPDQVWTVYDGANPYMDFDGEGQLQARYLYGPGIDELFARISTGEDPEWFLTDRLGSVRQIVNAAGTVLDEISYDSFGGILNESNPAAGERFKFTGREYCPELGLYYYRARWYDPAVGRFISQDPIGFSAGDPNLYRYVNNAPGDARDPEGLQTIFYESFRNRQDGLRLLAENVFIHPDEIIILNMAHGKHEARNEVWIVIETAKKTKVLPNITFLGYGLDSHCVRWTNQFFNIFSKIPSSRFAGKYFSLHHVTLEFPARGGPQHSIILIKNKITKEGWGLDNGGFGGDNNFFDPWEVLGDPNVPEETKKNLKAALEELGLVRPSR